MNCFLEFFQIKHSLKALKDLCNFYLYFLHVLSDTHKKCSTLLIKKLLFVLPFDPGYVFRAVEMGKWAVYSPILYFETSFLFESDSMHGNKKVKLSIIRIRLYLMVEVLTFQCMNNNIELLCSFLRA